MKFRYIAKTLLSSGARSGAMSGAALACPCAAANPCASKKPCAYKTALTLAPPGNPAI